MFSSLKTKLTLAFAGVTFLTVMLAALGTMFLLREREIDAARERVGQLGNSVAQEVAQDVGAGWQVDSLGQLLDQRAESTKLRFLLIDNNRGEVVVDTSNQLTGRSAGEITRAVGSMQRDDFAGFGVITWQDQAVFVPNIRQFVRGRVQTNPYDVLVLVPETDISRAWQGLLPSVLISGVIAMGVAVVVAYLLSRSITRPVADLTHASVAMAKGNYEQRIPVRGHDEMGRLAETFNTMAQEVSRSHRAMRDLNGNVAHELKTPLTSIQGYSQAMLDGVIRTPEDMTHAARVIYDESERMRRLVEDLLYLSRLESGQLQIERAPIHLPTLLETAAERAQWQAREGGRTVRLHLAIDLPVIQGDQGRLEQVLANLLDNALRHTPPEGVVTLYATWSLGHVTIGVHNTGSYIPPEHLSRIFERFYQVDGARSRGGRNGGLGLAIVREIVAAHGGSVTALSSQEGGTEFRVVLPTGQPRATATDIPTRPATPYTPPALPAPAQQGERSA